MEGLVSTGYVGLQGGGEGRAELGAVEGSVVLEHAKNRVQQLSHDRHQGDHFAFPASLQMQIGR